MMHRFFRAALVIALLFLAQAPRASAQANAAGGSAPDLLYVCNQDDASISVIDIGTLAVVRTIQLREHGFGPTAKPHHIVVEPDGSFWYVSLIGENRVLKFDRDDRLVGQLSFETPGMLALHPTEDLLFVGRSMTAVNPPPRIGAIPRSTFAKLDEIDVFFPRPHAMAVGPSSGIVYTASLGVNQMASVAAKEERVELLSVEGPQHALMQIAIEPDGNTMVASGELSHRVLVFDVRDAMKPKILHSIEVGSQPFDPIYTRDGRWVYVPNKAANTITVLDMQAMKVAKVLQGPGIAQPHGTVLSPDGRYVFVSSNNLKDVGHAMHGVPQPTTGAAAGGAAPKGGLGTVAVIDADTREIVKVIEVGHNATGMGARSPR